VPVCDIKPDGEDHKSMLELSRTSGAGASSSSGGSRDFFCSACKSTKHSTDYCPSDPNSKAKSNNKTKNAKEAGSK
jgi:hypothetical protein